MNLRLATFEDSDLLYLWRVLGEKEPWYRGKRTTRAEHNWWLADRIHNSCVRVWIVEADGVPVGVVRLDSNDEVSIEIDPEHRRKGYGGFALAEVCKRARGRVKANVDSMNTDARMAFEHAGFKEHSDVVFYVWRPDR